MGAAAELVITEQQGLDYLCGCEQNPSSVLATGMHGLIDSRHFPSCPLGGQMGMLISMCPNTDTEPQTTLPWGRCPKGVLGLGRQQGIREGVLEVDGLNPAFLFALGYLISLGCCEHGYYK